MHFNESQRRRFLRIVECCRWVYRNGQCSAVLCIGVASALFILWRMAMPRIANIDNAQIHLITCVCSIRSAKQATNSKVQTTRNPSESQNSIQLRNSIREMSRCFTWVAPVFAWNAVAEYRLRRLMYSIIDAELHISSRPFARLEEVLI